MSGRGSAIRVQSRKLSLTVGGLGKVFSPGPPRS